MNHLKQKVFRVIRKIFFLSENQPEVYCITKKALPGQCYVCSEMNTLLLMTMWREIFTKHCVIKQLEHCEIENTVEIMKIKMYFGSEKETFQVHFLKTPDIFTKIDIKKL